LIRRRRRLNNPTGETTTDYICFLELWQDRGSLFPAGLRAGDGHRLPSAEPPPGSSGAAWTLRRWSRGPTRHEAEEGASLPASTATEVPPLEQPPEGKKARRSSVLLHIRRGGILPWGSGGAAQGGNAVQPGAGDGSKPSYYYPKLPLRQNRIEMEFAPLPYPPISRWRRTSDASGKFFTKERGNSRIEGPQNTTSIRQKV